MRRKKLVKKLSRELLRAADEADRGRLLSPGAKALKRISCTAQWAGRPPLRLIDRG